MVFDSKSPLATLYVLGFSILIPFVCLAFDYQYLYKDYAILDEQEKRWFQHEPDQYSFRIAKGCGSDISISPTLYVWEYQQGRPSHARYSAEHSFGSVDMTFWDIKINAEYKEQRKIEIKYDDQYHFVKSVTYYPPYLDAHKSPPCVKQIIDFKARPRLDSKYARSADDDIYLKPYNYRWHMSQQQLDQWAEALSTPEHMPKISIDYSPDAI